MKNLPYWLKGGILIFIPIIVFEIINIITGLKCLGKADTSCGNFFSGFWQLFFYPLEKILFFMPNDSASIIVFPLMISYVFLIGAIIGWIYGKLKKHN